MKIGGLGTPEMEYLWENLSSKYRHIDAFIVAEEYNNDDRYITATKLIELRNQESKPILVLIPSNSRTAAEDSYGNATFKEIKLEGIELKLKSKLLASIPGEFQKIIILIIQDIAFIIFGQNFKKIRTFLYLSSI